MAKSKPLFESKVCSRCGGSGSYSYCSMYGTTCFGCSGSGWKLTKRGAMANNFLNESRKVPATDIKVGDLVLEDSVFAKPRFAKVLKVSISENSSYVNGVAVPCIVIESEGMSNHVGMTSKVRKGWSKEEKEAQRAAALAYQDTLTAMGKPKATKVKEAA